MANPLKGEVVFEAAGAVYTLRWSTNAMCELEEASGRGLNSIVRELASWGPALGPDGRTPLPETDAQQQARTDRIKVSTVRLVFWAMLRDHHPGIDLRQAGDLMQHAGGLLGAMALVNDAFERGAAPETKDARPSSPPVAARPEAATGQSAPASTGAGC